MFNIWNLLPKLISTLTGCRTKILGHFQHGQQTEIDNLLIS